MGSPAAHRGAERLGEIIVIPARASPAAGPSGRVDQRLVGVGVQQLADRVAALAGTAMSTSQPAP